MCVCLNKRECVSEVEREKRWMIFPCEMYECLQENTRGITRMYHTHIPTKHAYINCASTNAGT